MNRPLHRLSLAVLLLPFSSLAIECGIYLAPSTIPHAGMGMFAGNREYQKGDLLTDSDLMVLAIEINWHNDHKGIEFLWDEYVWSASMFPGMEDETEDSDLIHVCSGGMGAAVNCMLPLVNAMDENDSYAMGMSGVSPQSPGAGAFTPYYGRKFIASKAIEPGAEIYADYGESYFETRRAYEGVPLARDYKRADHLLTRFQRVSQHATAASTSDTDTLRIDLWNFIKDQQHLTKPSRILNALPANETLIETVMKTGGTAMQHYNGSIRTIEWLEEHGQCMDNIKDGVSTILHAGRGAFANRFISEGGLVAPAPLIHIPNREILTMYNAEYPLEDATMRRNASDPIHQQLLLNYCFGHRESPVLLCPYGLLTALINHSKKEPNTKIQWTKEMRHPEWITMELPRWAGILHTGLSLDFVALRDIEEGEEILVDYGDEWEQAWQEHVRDYDPPRQMYTPAFELNKMEDLRVRTIEEESYEDDGVKMYCRQTYLELAGLKANDPSAYDEEEEGLSPCRVLRRMHDDSYIAEIFERSYIENAFGDEIQQDIVHQVLFDAPRDAFFFRDSQYQREHHQVWSFRHDMRIPDSMFPEAWKNNNGVIKEEEEEPISTDRSTCTVSTDGSSTCPS